MLLFKRAMTRFARMHGALKLDRCHITISFDQRDVTITRYSIANSKKN